MHFQPTHWCIFRDLVVSSSQYVPGLRRYCLWSMSILPRSICQWFKRIHLRSSYWVDTCVRFQMPIRRKLFFAPNLWFLCFSSSCSTFVVSLLRKCLMFLLGQSADQRPCRHCVCFGACGSLQSPDFQSVCLQTALTAGGDRPPTIPVGVRGSWICQLENGHNSTPWQEG